jgi:hypothetical protein
MRGQFGVGSQGELWVLALSIHGIQWALTLASRLDNGEDRCGGAQLASLNVLAMGDRLPFAGGRLVPVLCARGDGLPVR